MVKGNLDEKEAFEKREGGKAHGWRGTENRDKPTRGVVEHAGLGMERERKKDMGGLIWRGQVYSTKGTHVDFSRGYEALFSRRRGESCSEKGVDGRGGVLKEDLT